MLISSATMIYAGFVIKFPYFVLSHCTLQFPRFILLSSSLLKLASHDAVFEVLVILYMKINQTANRDIVMNHAYAFEGDLRKINSCLGVEKRYI